MLTTLYCQEVCPIGSLAVDANGLAPFGMLCDLQRDRKKRERYSGRKAWFDGVEKFVFYAGKMLAISAKPCMAVFAMKLNCNRV
jgi:hypothetical protein